MVLLPSTTQLITGTMVLAREVVSDMVQVENRHKFDIVRNRVLENGVLLTCRYTDKIRYGLSSVLPNIGQVTIYTIYSMFYP